ncbi:class I SAM-dependent methyltransferase [Mycobacterium sp. Aquia_216]|uniref:class I SAM-dependent methyltransferase n=1 Tax=Mycobacterium sp. Aquia_216 TaxID=2991729 RepID=UPI00227A6176|nr:class I SAM-dependent methyltransferase [Mycobacterium sp. Aquia_216]WAJ47342.1 class I SAM-dependent methyltransferase [Mycobacterium sp. Aquia_216]
MSVLARRNEAVRNDEHWQPPSFADLSSARGRLMSRVRRALDLQAASIWRDLKSPLGQATGTILDVGAGAQPYRPLVSRRATYRAIDIADAGEQFGYEVPGTAYFSGDEWPAGDRTIDLVLATETLEHVPDPDAFLSEARRVLHDDGRLILTVPFAARWHYIPHDYWRFTPSALRMLLERNGFSEVVVFARGDELTVACAKIMALVLPFLIPQGGGSSVVRRLVGVAFSPVLLIAAFIGQGSLRRQGGDDCLGYTVFARAS